MSDFLAAKDRSMAEHSDTRSDCPNCGEWRDAPSADCASCGYLPTGLPSLVRERAMAEPVSGEALRDFAERLTEAEKPPVPWKSVALALLGTMKGIARDRTVATIANARVVAEAAVTRAEAAIDED